MSNLEKVVFAILDYPASMSPFQVFTLVHFSVRRSLVQTQPQVFSFLVVSEALADCVLHEH